MSSPTKVNTLPDIDQGLYPKLQTPYSSDMYYFRLPGGTPQEEEAARLLYNHLVDARQWCPIAHDELVVSRYLSRLSWRLAEMGLKKFAQAGVVKRYIVEGKQYYILQPMMAAAIAGQKPTLLAK